MAIARGVPGPSPEYRQFRAGAVCLPWDFRPFSVKIRLDPTGTPFATDCRHESHQPSPPRAI